MLNLAGKITTGEFLLIIVKTGGKTALGVFMHFFSANLKFDDALIRRDNGSMKRLVPILFRHGDVIFNSLVHWGVERMNNAEYEIAISDVANDNTNSDKIVDFVDILIILGEFFMKRINGFIATIDAKIDFFGVETSGNFVFDFG